MAEPLRTRAEQQEHTRERLIHAALDVFTERGFHGASVQEIATRAGFTKGAVYANFAGKEDLFLAVVDQRIETQNTELAELADAERTGHLDGDARAREYLAAAFKPQWGMLALEATLYAMRESPELLAELVERYRRIDAETIASLKAAGTHPPEAIPALALADSAVGDGLMFRRMIDPESASLELIEQVYATLRPDLDAS